MYTTALVRLHVCMITSRLDPAGVQVRGERYCVFTREAVYDTRLSGVLCLDEFTDRIHTVFMTSWLLPDTIMQIGPVEGAFVDLGVWDLQYFLNVH